MQRAYGAYVRMLALFTLHIVHRNYNDVMYTLRFAPTYGPLARRTTRVWAVFQTLPPCAKSLVPRLNTRGF